MITGLTKDVLLKITENIITNIECLKFEEGYCVTVLGECLCLGVIRVYKVTWEDFRKEYT